MDRRTFIVTGSATALVASTGSAFAAAKNLGAKPVGDAGLNATLDAAFYDGIAKSPETATSLGLDKGANAGLKYRLSPKTRAWQKLRIAESKRWAAKVRAIPVASLTETGKVFDARDQLWK